MPFRRTRESSITVGPTATRIAAARNPVTTVRTSRCRGSCSPAYETPIGAAIYPLHATGPYAFPPAYRGGAFVALHGSWHTPPVPPRVVFVPLHGDDPATSVDWNDPTTQWSTFVDRFQEADGSRVGRPTGVAVGPAGSLFVADDEAGVVYRIRPVK